MYAHLFSGSEIFIIVPFGRLFLGDAIFAEGVKTSAVNGLGA